MANKRRKPRRPAHRKRSRSQQGKNGNLIAILALAVVAFTVVAAVYFVGKTQSQMALDPQTLCPIETGPVAMTTILFDLTDPLTLTQANKLRTYIEKEIHDAEIGTQFTMGVVSDDPDAWGASPTLCKPRSGADVSVLTQNVKLVDARYIERFSDPMEQAMEEMLLATGAETSPILEALEGLVASTPSFLTYDGPRRVIIVSDLLQNSEAMSFYRGQNWDSFKASTAFQLVANNLDDADVQIYQIPRPIHQIKDLAVIEDFWVRYFDVQGSNLPHVKKM